MMNKDILESPLVEVPLCPHNEVPGLCKECLVAAMQAKKQAKKSTPIKSLKNRSKDQEREVSKGYLSAGFRHAKRQAMSGAISDLKGDVDPGELLLVECKMTKSGKLVIDMDWINQVEKQSRDMGRAGYYSLHTWTAGEHTQYKKVVVLPEELWFQILSQFKSNE